MRGDENGHRHIRPDLSQQIQPAYARHFNVKKNQVGFNVLLGLLTFQRIGIGSAVLQKRERFGILEDRKDIERIVVYCNKTHNGRRNAGHNV
jgi:hypothetical protein